MPHVPTLSCSCRGGGSSVGRAPGCGPGGRGFESRSPPLYWFRGRASGEQGILTAAMRFPWTALRVSSLVAVAATAGYLWRGALDDPDSDQPRPAAGGVLPAEPAGRDLPSRPEAASQGREACDRRRRERPSAGVRASRLWHRCRRPRRRSVCPPRRPRRARRPRSPRRRQPHRSRRRSRRPKPTPEPRRRRQPRRRLPPRRPRRTPTPHAAAPARPRRQPRRRLRLRRPTPTPTPTPDTDSGPDAQPTPEPPTSPKPPSDAAIRPAEPAPARPPRSAKPGWGNGDPNHEHTGPPGQQDKEKDKGKKK